MNALVDLSPYLASPFLRHSFFIKNAYFPFFLHQLSLIPFAPSILQIFSVPLSQLSLVDHSARFLTESAIVSYLLPILETSLVKILRRDCDSPTSSLNSKKLALKDAECRPEELTLVISAFNTAKGAVERKLFSLKDEKDSLQNINEELTPKSRWFSKERQQIDPQALRGCFHRHD